MTIQLVVKDGGLISVVNDKRHYIDVYPVRTEEGPLFGIGYNFSGRAFDQKTCAVVGALMLRFARTGELTPFTSVGSVRNPAGGKPLPVPDGAVYVGRPYYTADGYGRKSCVLAGHPLANPFRVGAKAGRDKRLECVMKYREWLRDPTEPGRRELAKALRGKQLMCWCGSWPGYGEPDFECHAIQIALLAEE